MVYYAAGSKEDEIVTRKLASFLKKPKASASAPAPAPAAKKSDLKFIEKEEREEPGARKSAKEGPLQEVAEVKKPVLKEADKQSGREIFKAKKGYFKKIALALGIIIILIAGGLFYRTSSLVSKISTKGGSVFGGLFKDKEDLAGAKEGRINILVIGIRGQNIPGGSLLADSIMVVSVRPEEKDVAMISIPRDLYVEIPGRNYSRKINEANPIGEEEGKGKGLELMKEAVSQVTGLDIHYAVSTNFNALRDTVDVLGGVTVHLDKPFYEGKQFVEGNECGGEFELPAGDVTLSGEKALCYSRARFATSDFDRARRQQQVLLAIKDKALSAGTLSDFSKVNDLLNVMGDNVLTDMQPWEIQKLYEVLGEVREVDDKEITHKVFDTTEEGLLQSDNNGSYILIPAAGEGNYTEIHAVCQNIFDSHEES